MGAVDDLRDFLRDGMQIGAPINRETLRLVLRALDMTTAERDHEAQRRLESETREGQAREALLAFVRAYANVERLDHDDVEIALFAAWMRGCAVLGIEPKKPCT
jgi:hypothetical protein